MGDGRKRDVGRNQRARKARFLALMESVVEDFMLDRDGVVAGENRPFEVVTENYVIRGRVSSIAASSDATEEGLPDRRDRRRRSAGAIGHEVNGIAHVLKYLLAIIRDYSAAMVRELDVPHRADAREVLEVAEAAAALIRRLLGPHADG